MIDRLVFECQIASGMGMYSELQFPSHAQVPGLPVDWPDKMYRGSLNAAVVALPDELSHLGNGQGIRKLDNRMFAPAGTIPQHAIGNNSISPGPGSDPERGAAQLWRAQIEVACTRKIASVWAVRRIGSAYHNIIELMSDQRLRDALPVQNGDQVTLALYAGNAHPAAAPTMPADKKRGWRNLWSNGR